MNTITERSGSPFFPPAVPQPSLWRAILRTVAVALFRLDAQVGPCGGAVNYKTRFRWELR